MCEEKRKKICLIPAVAGGHNLNLLDLHTLGNEPFPGAFGFSKPSLTRGYVYP